MITHSDSLTVENRQVQGARQARCRSHYSGPNPRFDMEAGKPTSKTMPLKARPPKYYIRVLLHNSKTRKFIGSHNRWTKDPKKATDFHTGWDATKRASTMNPRHLVVQYEFQDDRYNLSIPIHCSAMTT